MFLIHIFIPSYIDYIQKDYKKGDAILYGKDIQAPPKWQEYIKKNMMPELVWKTHGDILGGMNHMLL